ncbi:MAG: twin-arginine translocase TatA/TatE family subunit [Planctomycetota bacterium JB042]
MSSPVVLFLDLGFQELVVVMVVALLLYGGRLPEVARSLGRTVGEFKRSAQSLTREFRIDLDDRPPPPRPPKKDDPRRLPRDVDEDRREDVPPRDPADAIESDGEVRDAEADAAIGPRPRPTEPSEREASEDGETDAGEMAGAPPFSARDPLPDDEPPRGPPGTAPRQG